MNLDQTQPPLWLSLRTTNSHQAAPLEASHPSGGGEKLAGFSLPEGRGTRLQV